jgi:cell division protein FtsL
MKTVAGGTSGYRKFSRIAADALTGRLGVVAMVLGYLACAVALLGYVSSQVYTFSLMEDISKLERQHKVLKETVGLLTADYAELSSMDRITRICKEKLGMNPADAGALIRVSIDTDWAPGGARSDFDDEVVDLPGMMGRNIDELTEVMRR